MKEKTILFQYNIDSYGNPTSTKIKEVAQVSPLKYTIQLEQIPDEQFGVTLLNEDNTSMFQVFNYDDVEKTENSYYVNYTNGLIYFNSNQGAEKKVVNYYGTGVELISCKRVFDGHYDANGKWIVEILQDIIDAGREAIEAISTIGNASIILQNLSDKIAEGNIVVEELTNLKQEITQATNVTGNEVVIINAGDWVYNPTNNMYEHTINHTMNSKDLIIDCYNLATGDFVLCGGKIVNNNSVLIKSETNIDLKVVLNARYYKATLTISDDIAREVVEARKGHETVGERLDNFDSQLDNITHSKDYSNNSVLPVYDEPVISFVIDDGSEKYIDMFQSVFEENNIKPTLAIVSDWVGTNGYFTLSQLKEYKKKGYEIVGHSATHSNNIYKNNGSDSTVSADLKKCYDFLKENDFNSEVIVYPWGGFSKPNFYKNIARKYFNIGINAFAPNTINNKIPDTMYLERQFIQKFQMTIDQIKEKIDYAKNNNGWLIFGLHTVENECDGQMLREIINYIKLNGIKVMNISDAFKIKGNKLSIGEYDDIRSLYVNTKGEVKNGLNLIRWSESREYSPDRTPNEYETGITILNIHPNKNGGTPCTLLNFKGDNSDFYFQIKKDYETNQLWVREWNNTDSNWGNFNKIGFEDVETFNMIPEGDYTPEVRNNVKKVNNVLHCNISLVNPNKTGIFTQDLVLCKIDKQLDRSYMGKIIPCIITTADSKVKNGALTVNRDLSDGKIRIACHGGLDDTNIRWIDAEFTIVE